MKIGIISLGLIGGSIYKRLCGGQNEIYAVTRDEETISEAKKLGGRVSNDINSLKECEIVIVASPISKTEEMLDKLEEIVSSNCIVLDCASVKEFVMKKKRPYRFIGSHPMAGTEKSGYKNSYKEMFEGASWVLTPSENITEEEILKTEDIIMLAGANPIIADAKEHDEAVAQISHMPLLISQAVFLSATDNKLALKLASSGFRDVTRLACSNLDMAKDMRNFNKKNIEKALDKLCECINILKNSEDLTIFSDIKNAREKMYSANGKNTYNFRQ